MQRVAAEVAQEVGVFFYHDHVDAREPAGSRASCRPVRHRQSHSGFRSSRKRACVVSPRRTDAANGLPAERHRGGQPNRPRSRGRATVAGLEREAKYSNELAAGGLRGERTSEPLAAVRVSWRLRFPGIPCETRRDNEMDGGDFFNTTARRHEGRREGRRETKGRLERAAGRAWGAHRRLDEKRFVQPLVRLARPRLFLGSGLVCLGRYAVEGHTG